MAVYVEVFIYQQFHPDKVIRGTASEAEKAAATEKFQRINKAYELLASNESRHKYDISAAGKGNEVGTVCIHVHT